MSFAKKIQVLTADEKVHAVVVIDKLYAAERLLAPLKSKSKRVSYVAYLLRKSRVCLAVAIALE